MPNMPVLAGPEMKYHVTVDKICRFEIYLFKIAIGPDCTDPDYDLAYSATLWELGTSLSFVCFSSPFTV